VVYGFTMLDLKVPGIQESGTIDPTALAETEFAQPGVRQVGENEYEVYMVARQFLFLPGTGRPLTLPAGSEVTFHITSPDVIHGVHIPSTNINSMVIPGQVATFKTIFPEPRTYGMICHEYCGPAHHRMAGLIEIVPKSEFDESTLITSR
jgi:cytochrome c oxidase subunit 2